MMCAAVAGPRGKRVVLLDHAEKRAEKIRISGGGRCNFTNRVVAIYARENGQGMAFPPPERESAQAQSEQQPPPEPPPPGSSRPALKRVK